MLFRITNSQNVTVIVEKMLEFLRVSKDDYTTIDLVGKVAELAEKYPSESVDQTMSRSSVIFTSGGPAHLEKCKTLTINHSHIVKLM